MSPTYVRLKASILPDTLCLCRRAEAAKYKEHFEASLTLMDTRLKFLESAAMDAQQNETVKSQRGDNNSPASGSTRHAAEPFRAIQNSCADGPTSSPSLDPPASFGPDSRLRSKTTPACGQPQQLARTRTAAAPSAIRSDSVPDRLHSSFGNLTLGPRCSSSAPGSGIGAQLFGGPGERVDHDDLPVIGVRSTSELISRLSRRNQEAQQYLRKTKAL